MVKHGEDLWHCIHPEYLADQLARSRDRLQLAILDVCLVHNPEYFLAAGDGELEVRRSELYARLREAFGFLEEQARAGRIACYGVSSNTCAAGPEGPEATSLTHMLEAAREAGGEQHRFRVLQLPMNLRERSAAMRGNNGPSQTQTVLEHAAANGVGVLLNRPLNAIGDDGGLVRIADFPSAEARVELEAQLARLSDLEAEFNRQIAPHVRTGEGRLRADRLFHWGADLRGLAPRLSGIPHWEHIEASLLMPRLIPVLRTLDQTLAGPVAEEWREWRARYLPELDAAMAELRRRATEKSREQVAPLAAALDAGLPPERKGESLSRKALWVLASMPGVSSVLVGARKPPYVDDALGVLAWPTLSQPLELLARLPAASPSNDG
jgi:aryl-alcohol dehydrogenase-like predicted oxidoreductase